jgi:hypothetical protein
MSDSVKGATQVRTLTPQMTNARWMGALGHGNGLIYSYNYPGGCNLASWTLAQPPQWRTDALDPGRIVELWRGGSRIWEGIMDEPVQGSSGWSCTAHGNGTYGADYMAHYTSWTIDNVLNTTISRGLRWTKPTFGSIGWMQSVQDDAAITITDFMNNATIQAGLLWNVDVRQGNLVSIQAPPVLSAVTRLLVCTVPNPRTLSAGLNTLWYKYVSAQIGSSQVYTTTNVQNAAAATKWGNMEQEIDLTSAGVMTSGAAQANAQNILNQYIRTNFTQGYTVWKGQYLTLGGTPVDLGCETAYPNVVRLLLTDGSYGGEVVATPVTFVVGEYEYSDDTKTATITPYQSYKTDLSTLLTAALPELRQ